MRSGERVHTHVCFTFLRCCCCCSCCSCHPLLSIGLFNVSSSLSLALLPVLTALLPSSPPAPLRLSSCCSRAAAAETATHCCCCCTTAAIQQERERENRVGYSCWRSCSLLISRVACPFLPLSSAAQLALPASESMVVALSLPHSSAVVVVVAVRYSSRDRVVLSVSS